MLQVRKSFDMDHETITRLAEAEEAGSAGANFLPFLTGERTPNWPHSYGVITGIRQGGMRPGLLYRAALEGATFSLVNGTDSFHIRPFVEEDSMLAALFSADHIVT